jgi:UDP:flavonoid glycosyltransferase YjiC (YdhE family)
MNITNLVAVSSLVHRYGVKAVVYSGPGLGKTPLLTTAPNPVICFTEPGFLSVRKYNGPCYPAFTYREIREFWQWAISSQEARL